MLEMIKEVLLFGLVENFILMFLFKKVLKMKGVEWWHILPLILFLILTYYINFPFGKQLFGILVFSLYLKLVGNKTVDSIKGIVIGILYLLCIETICCFIFEVFIGLDLSTVESILNKFLILLPIRVIEVFLLFYIYMRRK